MKHVVTMIEDIEFTPEERKLYERIENGKSIMKWSGNIIFASGVAGYIGAAVAGMAAFPFAMPAGLGLYMRFLATRDEGTQPCNAEEAAALASRYEDTVDMLRRLLHEEKSPISVFAINDLQRSLSDHCTSEYSVPGFFDGRIEQAQNLLQQAEEYLRGTDYQEIAMERIEMFNKRVINYRTLRSLEAKLVA